MDIGKLTVTCPASFQQEQCLALREAIIKAGVEEGFRIVNEPTAAALSYAVDNGFKNEISCCGVNAAHRLVKNIEPCVAAHNKKKLELFLLTL